MADKQLNFRSRYVRLSAFILLGISGNRGDTSSISDGNFVAASMHRVRLRCTPEHVQRTNGWSGKRKCNLCQSRRACLPSQHDVRNNQKCTYYSFLSSFGGRSHHDAFNRITGQSHFKTSVMHPPQTPILHMFSLHSDSYPAGCCFFPGDKLETYQQKQFEREAGYYRCSRKS